MSVSRSARSRRRLGAGWRAVGASARRPRAGANRARHAIRRRRWKKSARDAPGVRAGRRGGAHLDGRRDGHGAHRDAERHLKRLCVVCVSPRLTRTLQWRAGRRRRKSRAWRWDEPLDVWMGYVKQSRKRHRIFTNSVMGPKNADAGLITAAPFSPPRTPARALHPRRPRLARSRTRTSCAPRLRASRRGLQPARARASPPRVTRASPAGARPSPSGRGAEGGGTRTTASRAWTGATRAASASARTTVAGTPRGTSRSRSFASARTGSCERCAFRRRLTTDRPRGHRRHRRFDAATPIPRPPRASPSSRAPRPRLRPPLDSLLAPRLTRTAPCAVPFPSGARRPRGRRVLGRGRRARRVVAVHGRILQRQIRGAPKGKGTSESLLPPRGRRRSRRSP